MKGIARLLEIVLAASVIVMASLAIAMMFHTFEDVIAWTVSFLGLSTDPAYVGLDFGFYALIICPLAGILSAIGIVTIRLVNSRKVRT